MLMHIFTLDMFKLFNSGRFWNGLEETGVINDKERHAYLCPPTPAGTRPAGCPA